MDKAEILQYAYQKVSTDNKLIRLATITTIIHSLIFIFYLIYQVHFVVSQIEGKGMDVDSITYYLQFLFGNVENLLIPFVVVGIVLIIGYFMIPPIAEATLIHYVDTGGGRSSLAKGITKFFPMFEFHGLFSLFNFLVYIIFLTRFLALGVLDSPVVIFVMIVWFLMTMGVSILLPYTKFFIVLKGESVSDAIKNSMSLAFENLAFTFKFVIVSYLLYLRFLVNILLIVGVPVLMIYIFSGLGLDFAAYLKIITYLTISILVLLSAYLNGIIEAFFITYWYKVFDFLTNPDKYKKEEPSTQDVVTQDDFVQEYDEYASRTETEEV